MTIVATIVAGSIAAALGILWFAYLGLTRSMDAEDMNPNVARNLQPRIEPIVVRSMPVKIRIVEGHEIPYRKEGLRTA